METVEQSALQIVVVEDNDADVVFVREALRKTGIVCDLRVVKDGHEAMAFIETLDRDINLPRVDLLLLDMHLPQHDGADILNCLRSTENYAQTPVIVMTGSSALHVYETALKHAAIHYFRKPANLVEFMQLGAIVSAIVAPGKSGG